MNTKKFLFLAIVMAFATSSVLALPALAAGNNKVKLNGDQPGPMRGLGQKLGLKGEMKPGVFGTVSAISGNTLTLAGHTVNGRIGSGRGGFSTSTPTTVFTVDAANAKITKNNVAGTIASIAVGDTVMVQGTVSGTSVVATTICDGIMRSGPGKGGEERPFNASSSPMIAGNGQPIIAGTISAISGATLTVTNKSNVAYTVDATNAKIWQGRNTVASLANLKVGDNVVVQGSVNGNSITASSIIDQIKSANLDRNGQPKKLGFFGGIGQFFGRIFGF